MGRKAWVCIEGVLKRAIIVSDEGLVSVHGVGLRLG